jgi:beta-lactamase regulating signal transducer with metallopeptidase domain
MIGAPWVGLAVVGSWFLVTMLAASVAVWTATPWLMKRMRAWPPARRGDALLAWRLLPSLLAMWMAGLVVAPGFLRQEEAGSTELVPIWMAALALGALATLCVRAAAALRALGAVRSHLRRAVSPPSERDRLPANAPCATDIVVSSTGTALVAGLWRPRIVVSRALASSLTGPEFEAVVAHERAHIGARDNLKRLAMLASPDWLGLTRRARQIEGAWAHATELAADDAVAARGSRAAIDLAAALVKAARLSAAPPARLELSSGMFDGNEMTTRVTRLATAESRPAGRPSALRSDAGPHTRRGAVPVLVVALALASALLLQVTPASRTLHQVSEWAVRYR